MHAFEPPNALFNSISCKSYGNFCFKFQNRFFAVHGISLDAHIREQLSL